LRRACEARVRACTTPIMPMHAIHFDAIHC
jgi:hypothetical protein